MIEYILKFSGCLLVLYTFYRLFLENEKLHFLKRYYLLLSLLMAIVLPLITISYNYYVEAVEPVNFENFTPVPSITYGQEVQFNEISWKRLSSFCSLDSLYSGGPMFYI
ncbi:hypothetical protein LZ575_10485 [Antarcticibacterium sp. 1MA-6-2]|uniref:hypothetical protein n=1 Tax=Antarcticibacterium sp. 1MA-6-2 TaxID=2908210 RepID=UPI001F205870|nr:hypothetical protein [Antarcticibacterium sp. 1MA-6-2]UJH92806.1 hypothetical protein LZ575_10485 [Antarcticibacterium sp. 1MA-6-2]